MPLKRAVLEWHEQSVAGIQRLLADHEATYEVTSAQDLLDKARISAFWREQIAKSHEALKNAS